MNRLCIHYRPTLWPPPWPSTPSSVVLTPHVTKVSLAQALDLANQDVTRAQNADAAHANSTHSQSAGAPANTRTHNAPLSGSGANTHTPNATRSIQVTVLARELLQSETLTQKLARLREHFHSPVLIITDIKPYQDQSDGGAIYPLLFELCQRASATGWEYGFSSQAFALPADHPQHLHFLLLLTELEQMGVRAPTHLSIPFNLFEPQGLETIHTIIQDPILSALYQQNPSLPKTQIWIERPFKAYPSETPDPFFMTAHPYTHCAGGQHEKIIPTLQEALHLETQLTFTSLGQPLHWMSSHLDQFLDLHFFEHTVKTILRPLLLKVFEYHQQKTSVLEVAPQPLLAQQYLGLAESLFKEMDEHLRNHAHVRAQKLAEVLRLPSAQSLAQALLRSYRDWIGPLPAHIECGFVLESPQELSALQATAVVSPPLDIDLLNHLDPTPYTFSKETKLQWLTQPARTSTTI